MKIKKYLIDIFLKVLQEIKLDKFDSIINSIYKEVRQYEALEYSEFRKQADDFETNGRKRDRI